MAKIQANGNIRVTWALEAAVTVPEFPTATQLNAGLNLSSAISWEDYALGSTGSDDIDDRALTDLGNEVSRGSANYEAVLDFFREANRADSTSSYLNAFQAFRTSDVVGYLVTRVGIPSSTAFAAGDIVSVFRVIISHTTDVATGDTSTKFQVTFLSQGLLHTHTVVQSASAILGVPTTNTRAVNSRLVLAPTLDGRSIRSVATYTSSAPAIATVSNQGVVVARAAGSATITVSYAGGGAAAVLALTVTV